MRHAKDQNALQREHVARMGEMVSAMERLHASQKKVTTAINLADKWSKRK